MMEDLRITRDSDNEVTLEGLRPSVGGFWITVGNASVYLRRDSSGLAVDVYPLQRETQEAVASCYAPDSELNDRRDNDGSP